MTPKQFTAYVIAGLVGGVVFSHMSTPSAPTVAQQDAIYFKADYIGKFAGQSCSELVHAAYTYESRLKETLKMPKNTAFEIKAQSRGLNRLEAYREAWTRVYKEKNC